MLPKAEIKRVRQNIKIFKLAKRKWYAIYRFDKYDIKITLFISDNICQYKIVIFAYKAVL